LAPPPLPSASHASQPDISVEQDKPSGLASAARYYKRKAKEGKAYAQNRLGRFHQEGLGVPQSYAEAARLFGLAADQGFADGQNNLGCLYEIGRGVPQSDAEAARLFRLAADQGHAAAQVNLGALYLQGRGVPQSDAEAARFLRLAADQGFAPALSSLGVLYETGRGVPQSYEEAAQLYKAGVEQNFSEGQDNLIVLEFERSARQNSDLVSHETVQDGGVPGAIFAPDRGAEPPPEALNLSTATMDDAAIDLNAAADEQGVSRSDVLKLIERQAAETGRETMGHAAGKPRLPQTDVSDAEAVELVFGNIPDGFRTVTYKRNPHPELVHHPAVLAQAKEIVSANSRTKIADLEPAQQEILRQARRVVRANERHPEVAPRAG
jgi:hypothetical protein